MDGYLLGTAISEDAKCPECRSFDINDEFIGYGDGADRGFKIPGLHTQWILPGKEQGCVHCTLMLDVLDKFLPSWNDDAIGLFVYVRADMNRTLEMWVSQANEIEISDQQGDVMLVVHIGITDVDNVISHLGLFHPLPISSKSRPVLDYIQSCLTKCQSHEKCNRTSAVMLPLRVVDVGCMNDQVKLLQTNGLFGEYIALSYVWGPSQHLFKTTRENLDTLQHKIDMADLAPTLQDAIWLTRELGLQYIWIDCLCIVQDDIEDWENEAAKMATYYSDANLTVAASWGTDVSSGLFHERNGISEPKILKFTDQAGIEYAIAAQTRGLQYIPSRSEEPLWRRGWTFQENVLSTRVVHFTNSQLVWECHTEMLSEDTYPIKHLSSGLIGDLRWKRHNDWCHFVELYAQRQLTHHQDRLPAIAGLAYLVQSETGFTYAAGMWKETMATDLLWVTDPRASWNELPSWSWASVNGPVMFVKGQMIPASPVNLKSLCHVHEVVTTLRGNNKFGQVDQGRLIIDGPMMELTLNWDGKSLKEDIPDYVISHIQDSDLTFLGDSYLEATDVAIDPQTTIMTARRSHDTCGKLKVQVWCLWILCKDGHEFERLDVADFRQNNLFGIVLARSTAFAEDETYRRIGSVMAKTKKLLDYSTMNKIMIK